MSDGLSSATSIHNLNTLEAALGAEISIRLTCILLLRSLHPLLLKNRDESCSLSYLWSVQISCKAGVYLELYSRTV